MVLTFDRSGRKVSEEADGHFQNISFLQLGVAGVVFANERQNQALQVAETLIDTSASPLFQQRFQSLEGRKKQKKIIIRLHRETNLIRDTSSQMKFCVACVSSLPFSARWLVSSGPRWTWRGEAGSPRR